MTILSRATLNVLFALTASVAFAVAAENKPAPKPAPQAATQIKLTVRQLLLIGENGSLAKIVKQDFPPSRAETRLRVRLLWEAVSVKIPAAQEARNSLFTNENSIEVSDANVPKGLRRLLPSKDAEFNANPVFDQVIQINASPLTKEDIESSTLSAFDEIVLAPIMVSSAAEEVDKAPKK